MRAVSTKMFAMAAIAAVAAIGVIRAILPEDLKSKCGAGSGNVKDEALCAGRSAETLRAADEDYFRDMDNGATKNPEAIAKALAPFVPGITPEEAAKTAAIGRNNWIVWTAGNDRMWDVLNRKSFGEIDLLKTLSNHPSLKFSRSNRWNHLGLLNEPCFKKPTEPRKDRFGLLARRSGPELWAGPV